jgi:integration host factor subunit alpha
MTTLTQTQRTIPLATLTKARIVENLLAKKLFTKTVSAQIIETLFELLKQSLEQGDDVLISGFGKFSVQEKNQRRGRNPQSGETIMLPPRKVVTFKCSGILRDKINQGKEKQQVTATRRWWRP